MSDVEQPNEQVTRSSDEQAEVNADVAGSPQATVAASSSGLIGHNTETSVEVDSNDQVRSVHETTVITDPNDELAVQVPAEFENGDEQFTQVHTAPTPLEVRAANDDSEEDVEPVVEDPDDPDYE